MTPEAARFSARLKAEFEIFQEFHRTLQLEQAALIRADAENLLEITTQKAELYRQLSEFGAERDRALAAAGLTNDAPSVAAWLAALGVDAATRDKWTRLLELARDAEQLNQQNGRLIETHLTRNRQALAVLHAAASPANLYGRNGQISGAGLGQSRDKA